MAAFVNIERCKTDKREGQKKLPTRLAGWGFQETVIFLCIIGNLMGNKVWNNGGRQAGFGGEPGADGNGNHANPHFPVHGDERAEPFVAPSLEDEGGLLRESI